MDASTCSSWTSCWRAPRSFELLDELLVCPEELELLDELELRELDELLVSPGALELLVSPGALELLVLPGALELLVSPGALELLVSPGALELLVSPGALELLLLAAGPTLDGLVMLVTFTVLEATLPDALEARLKGLGRADATPSPRPRPRGEGTGPAVFAGTSTARAAARRGDERGEHSSRQPRPTSHRKTRHRYTSPLMELGSRTPSIQLITIRCFPSSRGARKVQWLVDCWGSSKQSNDVPAWEQHGSNTVKRGEAVDPSLWQNGVGRGEVVSVHLRCRVR